MNKKTYLSEIHSNEPESNRSASSVNPMQVALRSKTHHRKEWERSAIAPEIIEANLHSVEPFIPTPYDEGDELPEALYLLNLEADITNADRRNDGRLTDKEMRRFYGKHLTDGGWWSQGFDLITGERSLFGCYKPDSPRWDYEKGKPIKYEHPKGMSSGVFVPAIPKTKAGDIIFRYGEDLFCDWLAFLEKYNGDEDFAIWEFAKSYAIALHITEGYKKASSLISQGFLAVALPGIWNWIDKDAEKYIAFDGKTKRKKELTKLLKPLTNIKREVCLWFDEDTKPSTVHNVTRAQTALGKALSKEGCKVSVAKWESKDGKGIDDAIAANGKQWLEDVYQRRLSLSAWLYWNQKLSHVDRLLNKPFLTKDDLDTASKLMGIKAPKGTGKTEAIANYVDDLIKEGKPVIVLSHRVQLVRALSERFGIDNAYNFRTSDTRGVLGLALCVDSLHQKSQVMFNPQNWDDFTLIIDEVEQVIPHTLISTKTAVADNRTEVLANLSTLCQNASQIILSDADLSDRSLNYISSLTGNCNQKVICNDFQPAQGRKLYNYNTPETWLQALTDHVKQGEKILIPIDAQQAKSKWGAQTIESYLAKLKPDAKMIRIDSKTISNPDHPAFRATEDDRLDDLIINYDIVIYTNVIGTGISIDIKGHFDAVFSCNQGTQSENSTRQFLARLRDDVPRHCFFKKIGVGFLGGGETEARAVKKSQKAKTKQNLAFLKKLEDEALEFDSFESHVNSYCSYVANHNLGMSAYREIVLEGLRREGYDITTVEDISEDDRGELKQEVTGHKESNYSKHCSAIEQAETPSETELETLENKQELTDTQRHQLRKGKLGKLYGVEVDQELIQQDDDGLYPQLALLFWLTVGRDKVEEIDHKKAKKYQEKTAGQGYDPDFNRTQYQAKVTVVEALRLPEFIAMEGQEITNESIDWWWEHITNLVAQHYNTKTAVKRFLGLTLSDKESPIRNLGKLLERVGYSLTYIKQLGENKNRQRVYRIDRVTRHQDQIFAYWLSKLEKEVEPESCETEDSIAA